jgi:hypothetical protein
MKYNDLKNGDIVKIDLREVFENATIYGQAFIDEDDNIEIYIQEGKYNTDFYIKVPKSLKHIDK